MSKVIVNTFDGGQAQDIRTSSSKESQTSINYDIYTYPHLLTPHPDMVAETGGTITDYDITDVVACDYSGSTYLIGYGRESAGSSDPAFFRKNSTTDISAAWVTAAVYTSITTPQRNTAVVYNGKVHALTSSNLIELTDLTTTTFLGNIVGTTNTNPVKPFVHPEDDILYFANANVVGSYDYARGTPFLGTALELPSTIIITSITNYGSLLAISCKPINGSGRSVVYLWDRDSTSTTGLQVVDWGDSELEVLENIGEILVGISGAKDIGAFTAPTTTQTYKYLIRAYGGGSVQTVKEFVLSDGSELTNLKGKINDKLYFGFNTQNALFVLGKNKSGEWFVSKSIFVNPTASFITGNLLGISTIGETFFIAYADGGVTSYLARSASGVYENMSTYRTTINPGMTYSDKLEQKTMLGFKISYKVLTAGTITVGLYTDNSSSPEEIVDSTHASSGEYFQVSRNCTNGSPFATGAEFEFLISTTGYVQVKEIMYVYIKTDTL